MDHSIQIGKVQCFLILGVDLSKYSFGRPIRREDCEPILLKPMFKSNGEEVCQAMYEACKKTGIPRQVCIDGGSDLGAGCKLFCRDNPGLFIIRDIAHKVANLLKARLEHNKAWNEFTSLLSKIKSNLQQTSYAFLIPTSQREKSRFMNIESNTFWSKNMLNALKQGNLIEGASKKIQTLFSRLQGMEVQIQHFIDLEKVGSLVRHFVRERGICLETTNQLENCLYLQNFDMGASSFAGEVLNFIHEQAKQVPYGEILIGSTEIIESVFGSYKYLQGDRGCFGTTRLALYLGACVGEIDESNIKSALTNVTEDYLDGWCNQFLGKTFLQERRGIFNQGKVHNMGGKMEYSQERIDMVKFA